MPKLLVNRLSDDSIGQLREVARMRDEDARRLLSSGRGTAAIYLWGYAAEMTLKAGWFELIGFSHDASISLRDLRDAKKQAFADYRISLHGFHDVFGWARLLREHRMTLGRAYGDPDFGRQVVEHSRQIYERWRETMRYKKNVAYAHEVRTVAECTDWLLQNSLRL